MFVCCCLGTADPVCTEDQGELGCNCTAAVCTCKNENMNCEFADNKLKCSWSEKACPELDCTAPADGTKTAICVKAGNDPDTLILSAMDEGGAACTGKTAVCTDPLKGATTVVSSVPASKDPAGTCNESCHDSLATSYSHSLTQSDRLCLTHCIHLPADCMTRRTNERTTGHSCKIVQMKIKNVKKRDRNKKNVCKRNKKRYLFLLAYYNCDSSAIRARHATTRYVVVRALAYEIDSSKHLVYVMYTGYTDKVCVKSSYN